MTNEKRDRGGRGRGYCTIVTERGGGVNEAMKKL